MVPNTLAQSAVFNLRTVSSSTAG